MLRGAGIPVEVGLLGAEAEALNEGFFMRVLQGRPFVTLKLATTLDGRIATRTGESRWITGEEARTEVHRMRATSDAVMVGTGTALADDPMLTIRLPDHDGRQPLRIVLDAKGRLPPTLAMFRSAKEVRTLVVRNHEELGPSPEGFLRSRPLPEAVQGITLPEREDGQIDLAQALRSMAAFLGLTRILVEGGAKLSAGLLAANLVDRLVWFRAPILMGGDGIPAVGPMGVSRLAEARRLVRTGMRMLGQDSLETYEPAH